MKSETEVGQKLSELEKREHEIWSLARDGFGSSSLTTMIVVLSAQIQILEWTLDKPETIAPIAITCSDAVVA